MCGIAGAINFRLDEKQLKKDLYHRGPDDFSKFKYKNLELYHFRLAIQDIKGGKQPFIIENGNYVIAFNGEIYNHLELREKVPEYRFRTRSDTETLIVLYTKYGKSFLDDVDGMFAFCIFDKKANKLVFGRDRAGKKPLYYFKKRNIFIFASELNAIRNQINPDINEDAIYAYLRTGFMFRQTTPFNDIYEIENGFFYELDLKDLVIKKEQFFDIGKYYYLPKIKKEQESIELIDEVLKKSVKNRLFSSDLEVGAFLSGGIDSNLVVAVASNLKSNLKTFTVKFDENYDESPLAELAAKKYGTAHTTIEIKMNLKNEIEKILSSYGEPFMDSSAIPSFYVSREAKRHVTVVLNGDGADELFAGYRRYVPIANNWARLAKILAPLNGVLPKPEDKMSIYNYFYRLLSMSRKSGLDFYLSATTDIFEDEYNFSKRNLIILEIETFIKNVKLTGLDKMLYLDFNILLFSDLLVKMDIATMQHSLEARSPFLSKYFLTLAPTIDSKLKIKGITTKYILRKLAERYLPKELINQPKRGFEVPLKKWVNEDLKETIFDYLTNSPYSSTFIKKTFIDNLLNNKLKVSQEKRAKMLWSMFCLEVWRKSLK